MTTLHRTCYASYFYGDEYTACQSCRDKLLDEEELFCFGAHTEHPRYKPFARWPCESSPRSCNTFCRNPSCHCVEAWTAMFRLLLADCDYHVNRFLPEDTTPAKFGCLYAEGYGIAFRITHNDADSHDAVQTAFYKIHRMDSYPIQLRALFRRAVANAALDIVEGRKRFTPIEEHCLPGRGGYLIDICADERAKGVAVAMECLTAQERSILIMRHVDEVPVSVIAETLKISVSATHSRLHQARKRLREELLRQELFNLAG